MICNAPLMNKSRLRSTDILQDTTLHHGGPRRWSALILVALICVPLSAQQPQPPAQATPVFRSGTHLVVETVTVKDKDGKAVEGLTAKDFTVTEDGEAQTISFVEYQRVDAAAALSAPSPVAPTPAPPAPASGAVAPVVQPTIAAASPGDIKYRNRRLLVL